MIPAITTWLAFVAATGVVVYFGTRGQAIAFAVIVAMVLPASFHALGRAAPWQPGPGKHSVLGARIDLDKAIFVLVDGTPEPRFYRLPYSKQAANDLQAAMDSLADGEGEIVLQIGEDGALGFREETPPDAPPKQAATPLVVN